MHLDKHTVVLPRVFLSTGFQFHTRNLVKRECEIESVCSCSVRNLWPRSGSIKHLPFFVFVKMSLCLPSPRATWFSQRGPLKMAFLRGRASFSRNMRTVLKNNINSTILTMKERQNTRTMNYNSKQTNKQTNKQINKQQLCTSSVFASLAFYVSFLSKPRFKALKLVDLLLVCVCVCVCLGGA